MCVQGGHGYGKHLSGFLSRRLALTFMAASALWSIQLGTSWAYDTARYPFEDAVENPSSGMSKIKAVDMNDDGHLDLVGTGSGGLQVVMGDGTGAFADPQVIQPVLSQYALGDANGDGLPDLAVRRPDGAGGVEIAVLINDGTGLAFTTTAVIPIPNSTSLWALAPFGGGSNGDLLTTDGGWVGNPYQPNATISVWPGNGDGTFAPSVDSPITIAVPHETDAIHLTLATSADLDGDGIRDAVLGNNVHGQAGDIFVMKGRSDRGFESPVRVPDAHGSSDITIGDLNGDDLPDLVTSGTRALGDPTDYAFNLGGLNFSDPQQLFTNDRGPWPTLEPPEALADFDGDGLPDIVAPSGQYQPVGISYGLAGGGFSLMEGPLRDLSVPEAHYGAVEGDFNEDGLPDVAVGGPSPLGILLHKRAPDDSRPPDGGGVLGNLSTSGTGLHVLKHHFPRGLRQLLNKGVTATVSCDVSCELTSRLVAHNGSVKAFGLPGATLVRTRTTIAAGRVVKVRVRPTGAMAEQILAGVASGKSLGYRLRLDSTPAS
jgi:hypothetical protein